VNFGLTSKYKEKFIVSVRNQWVQVNTKDIDCFSKEALIIFICLMAKDTS